MNNFLTKILIALSIILTVIALVFWIQKNKAQNETFQAKQEIKRRTIAEDSLLKLSDGYYQKLVADTLTKKELKRLAEDIIELKNRKPVSVTKTIIQPVEIRKETDSVSVTKDSVFIEDFYPGKDNSFLKYTNRLSLTTQQGISNFDFQSITLTNVVTKKENGLYQVDFKGPEFLELKSLDIQTEPVIQPVKDNWGTLIGLEYGKNLDSDENIFELNAYQRYKKFYIGGGVSSNKNIKGGFKIEF